LEFATDHPFLIQSAISSGDGGLGLLGASSLGCVFNQAFSFSSIVSSAQVIARWCRHLSSHFGGACFKISATFAAFLAAFSRLFRLRSVPALGASVLGRPRPITRS
jgi:hypothetical protein